MLEGDATPPRRRRPGGPGHGRDGRGRLGRWRSPVDGVVFGVALRARLWGGRQHFWITAAAAASWPPRREARVSNGSWSRRGVRGARARPPRTPRNGVMASTGSTAGPSGRAWTSRRRRGEHPGISRRFSNHDLHAIDATCSIAPDSPVDLRQVGQLSRPSMVATLALGTKIGGALCRRASVRTSAPCSSGSTRRTRRRRGQPSTRRRSGEVGAPGRGSCLDAEGRRPEGALR